MRGSQAFPRGGARYRIPDEPLPSGLARHAVSPIWPLLAVMFAGFAAGMAWFAFNLHALGSPSRLRQWALIVAGLLGAPLYALAVFAAADGGHLGDTAMRYALLGVPVLKIALAYALLLHQLPLAELLEYYERPLKNGMPALLMLGILAHALIDPETLPWYAMVLLR